MIRRHLPRSRSRFSWPILFLRLLGIQQVAAQFLRNQRHPIGRHLTAQRRVARSPMRCRTRSDENASERSVAIGRSVVPATGMRVYAISSWRFSPVIRERVRRATRPNGASAVDHTELGCT